MRTRIGILGGTFDPVHLGHLASAIEVADAYSMDRVMLVLSARPPHKSDGDHASISDRLSMLELAVGPNTPLFEISEIEAERPGPSYMVDTLATLAERFPNADLALILGIDAYREIDTWHRAGDLLSLADLVVTSRPESGPDASLEPPIAARNACCYDSSIGRYLHSSGHTLSYHQLSTGLAISASTIRRMVGEGTSVDHLVGRAVARYIEQKGLYLRTS